MTESYLYKKLDGSRVRCNTCQWQCVIGPDKYGICRARKNENGILRVLNYAKVASIAADPIEKKPLYHYFPGSLCLSLGTLGCNFHCIHCQNYHISCIQDPYANDSRLRDVTPKKIVELARQHECAGVSWTYNEPSIWFEYTLDSAKLAKQNGLYTVYVTNGYLTTEALDTIGPYLDAWRVDIKGFTDTFYQRLAKIKKWRGILEVAHRAKNKWDMHVEVVTNIIPGLNDDEQLTQIATWIKDQLGDLTPWHVTRFYPQFKLKDIPPTPIETLEKAYDIGVAVGLKFVYIGNVPGHTKENTVCYQCHKVIIKRMGYNTQVVGLNGSKCQFCGAELNVHNTLK